MGGIFGSRSSAGTQNKYIGIQIQTSSAGLVLPVVYGSYRVSPNLLYYARFSSYTASSGKGGGSGSGKNPVASTRYQADVQLGLCEGPIFGIGRIWQGKNVTNPASLIGGGASADPLYVGTYPQAPNSVFATQDAAHVPGYTGIAHYDCFGYNLGNTAQLPNHNFQVYGFFSSKQVVYSGTIPTVGFPGIKTTASTGSTPSYPSIVSYASYAPTANFSPGILMSPFSWADGSTGSLLASVVSVVVNGTTTLTYKILALGTPGAGQYCNDHGLILFNQNVRGLPVVITYIASGLDADPSLVIQDMLSSPYRGMGIPASIVGEYTTKTASATVPASGPYTIVVSANPFVDNLCVTKAGVTLTCVASSPTGNQYSYAPNTPVAGQGTYTFSSSLAGQSVSIEYVANMGLPTYQNYVNAFGLLISMAYTTQSAGASVLHDIATFTNSEFVCSGGCIKIIPRGDTALTANGYTYTPPSSAVVSLGVDDFVADGNTSPTELVKVTRMRPSDQDNYVQLEYVDASQNYNVVEVSASDSAFIDLYGRRTKGSQQAPMITNGVTATLVAQLLLQKSASRTTFECVVDIRYCFLEVMDIITVTDPGQNLTAESVRIIAIKKENNLLTLTCEDYLGNLHGPSVITIDPPSIYHTNSNYTPAPPATVAIVAPPTEIAETGNTELWLYAASSDSLYGGCQVWVSTDNITYKNQGNHVAGSRMGVLTTSTVPAAQGVSSSTISVDLTNSAAQLSGGSTHDADVGNTLAMLGSELISYSTANLTAAYQYDLTTYIQRGKYTTPGVSHTAGETFVRLDDTKFVIPFDRTQVGKTLYVKLVPYNIYGGGVLDISSVDPVVTTLQGPPTPAAVQNFAVSQNSGNVIISWTNLVDASIKGYDILYGAIGGTVGTAHVLTEASRSTEMTTAIVPPGIWTFYIRARNYADVTGPVSSQSLTVSNTNTIIKTVSFDPAFNNGTLTNFILHPSGCLVPDSNDTANGSLGWRVFDEFVPDYKIGATFVSGEYDLGSDAPVRLYGTTTVHSPSGAVVVIPSYATTPPGSAIVPNATMYVQYRTSSGSYSGIWTKWTAGSFSARYFKVMVTLDYDYPGAIDSFDITVDAVPTSYSTTVFVPSAGLSFSFPAGWNFHNVPSVVVSPTSGTATNGSATSPTTTSAFLQLFNGITAVSGNAIITATGV